MKIVQEKVKHNVFGEGVISRHDENYISVKFAAGEKKFKFPYAFEKHLTIENPLAAVKIEELLVTSKAEDKEVRDEKKAKEAQAAQDRMDAIHASIATPLRQSTTVRKPKPKLPPKANLAIKCSFNDGGLSDERIGFHGVCSDETIRSNIEVEKRALCSADDCACNQYLKGELSREQLEDKYNSGETICYESQMLQTWKAMAGIAQSGVNKGKPLKLRQVKNNKLCVLTTRDPISTESDRYIFAVFLIDEAHQGDQVTEGYVKSKSKYRLALSPDEAKQMLFWNYHANQGRPTAVTWSSGLHRYLTDEQAAQILRDIADLKPEGPDKVLAQSFLEHYAKRNYLDLKLVADKAGALIQKQQEQQEQPE